MKSDPVLDSSCSPDLGGFTPAQAAPAERSLIPNNSLGIPGRSEVNVVSETSGLRTINGGPEREKKIESRTAWILVRIQIVIANLDPQVLQWPGELSLHPCFGFR
jgi:hypothetical protein